jgi:GR25 family glycosyltransferase involved in LPS biosynthesis
MGVSFAVFVITVKGSTRWPINLDYLGFGNHEIHSVESLSTKFDAAELAGLHKGRDIYSLTVGRDMSLSEIGCAYGHQLAYESFLRTTNSWALILEDDADMQSPIQSLFTTIQHKADPSVISLIDRRGGIEYLFRKCPSPLMSLLTPSQATSAYLINRNAAAIFLENYNRRGILSPSDWPYPQSRKISFYSLREPIFKHEWSSLNSLISQERDLIIRTGFYDPVILRRFTIIGSLQRILKLRHLGLSIKETFYAEFTLKLLSILALNLKALQNRIKKF